MSGIAGFFKAREREGEQERELIELKKKCAKFQHALGFAGALICQEFCKEDEHHSTHTVLMRMIKEGETP